MGAALGGMQAGLAPILPPADTLPVMRILWILAATCLLIECVLYLACATGGRTRRTSSSCLTASPTAAHAITGTRFAPGGAQKSRHGLGVSPPRSSAQAPLQNQADSLIKAAAPLAGCRRINLPSDLVGCRQVIPSLAQDAARTEVELARGDTLTTGVVSGRWWLKPVFD